MTDIEAKALALVNELFAKSGGSPIDYAALFGEGDIVTLALLRAIEAHEAFKQEVSDAVVGYFRGVDLNTRLHRFIIPQPEPDPLVRIINEVIYAQPDGDINEATMAKDLRAALEARGLEIVEKGQ